MMAKIRQRPAIHSVSVPQLLFGDVRERSATSVLLERLWYRAPEPERWLRRNVVADGTAAKAGFTGAAGGEAGVTGIG